LLVVVAWGTLGVFFVGAYLAAHRDELTHRPARVYAGLYLCLLAGWAMNWLTAVMHEVGHALAAILFGRRVYVFAIGPVGWTRDQTGRLRFGRVRRFKGNAGYVIAFGDRNADSRTGDIAFFLGGCIANVVIVAACMITAARLDSSPLRTAALVMAYLNAVFAILNLLPLRSRSGLRTDGLWVVDRLFNRITPEHAAVFDASRLQYSGVRPRELPQDVVDRLRRVAAAAEDDPPSRSADETVIAQHLLHEVALDTGDIATATRHYTWLAERFERMPDYLQHSLTLTLAWFAAFHSRDAALARKLIGNHIVAPTSAALRTSTQAAIAIAEGNLEEAQRLADQSLREFEKTRAFHTTDAFDRLNEVRSASRANVGSAPPAGTECP
jgi:Zn-dependent protease